MATIQSCLRESYRLQKNSDTARLDAEVLLSAAIGKDRTYLYTWPEKVLSAQQLETYQKFLECREQGEPVAYLIGYQEFWSLKLAVNASTLIPRPETELLVELALELTDDTDDNVHVLDLGTGTGAVALAIASERRQWHLTAIEENSEALALAKHNQQTHQLTNVTIMQSDWFAALQPCQDCFDTIVANPPYIDKNDKHLSQGDVRYEPLSALVADQAGLNDIAHIVKTAPTFLKVDGVLLLEHGYQQEAAVAQLFREYGYSDIFCRRDLAGQPRVSGARLRTKK